jgi:molecular chaperone DnaK
VVERILGLDFGTTNSLAAYIDPRTKEPRSLTNREDGRPHPSTVWFRAGQIIVGREARANLEAGKDAVSGAFVRSPKRLLIQEAPIDIDGSQMDPREIVAEVLKYLRADAASTARGESAAALDSAVMTIPVDLNGDGRRRLRDAARKAGIGVVQFVHEPLAALYAWLRSHADYQRRVAELEGRRILVFDWGGGTLDLTLCFVHGRKLIQVANLGDNEVGGDFFDDTVRNRVRELHAAQHGLEDIFHLETTESRMRLLAQCELAKIALSTEENFPIFVSNYLRSDTGRHLDVVVSRQNLEEWTAGLISQGLAHVDRLLEKHNLSTQEVELCIPTGGMVNLPIVRAGLVERFGARVPKLSNGDRIIAEGAAWIAHDRLHLSLAKPIELLQPDGSYVEIVPDSQILPQQNQTVPVVGTQYYCADPQDGKANFVFARPTKVGYSSRNSPRQTYASISLKIDPLSQPFLERLNVQINIDHDYIVSILLHSSGRQDKVTHEIHDLEFALTLPWVDAIQAVQQNSNSTIVGQNSHINEKKSGLTSVKIRSNVCTSNASWDQVPGDIIEKWRPGWFDNRGKNASEKQRAEKYYYVSCSVCQRTICDIQLFGCDCGHAISKADAALRIRSQNINL